MYDTFDNLRVIFHNICSKVVVDVLNTISSLHIIF